MASISVPCPKSSLISPGGPRNQNLKQLLIRSTRFPKIQGPNHIHFPDLKAKAATEGPSNSSLLPSTKLETSSSHGKDSKDVEGSAHQSAVSYSTISAFMAEVSALVKLVDSRDIMELKLKQLDSELILRKNRAFAQSAPTAASMLQPPEKPMLPSQPSTPHSTPAALPPASKGSKSSLPPLKCPMAGIFYRCPAPGEPVFVKVGDKVQKGQVVCIIEAMKLMNEIEADRSGMVVEILVEDGKPVSIDTPLLVIQP